MPCMELCDKCGDFRPIIDGKCTICKTKVMGAKKKGGKKR